MPAPSEVWDHFHKDSHYYKSNQSHKQSLCKYCVQKIVNFLVDQSNAALAARTIVTFRDPTVIEKEGELTVHSESVSMLIFTLVLDTTFSGDPDVPCSFGSSIQLHILAGKVDLLWKHLGICPFAPTAVKDLANANTAAKHHRSAT